MDIDGSGGLTRADLSENGIEPLGAPPPPATDATTKTTTTNATTAGGGHGHHWSTLKAAVLSGRFGKEFEVSELLHAFIHSLMDPASD